MRKSPLLSRRFSCPLRNAKPPRSRQRYQIVKRAAVRVSLSTINSCQRIVLAAGTQGKQTSRTRRRRLHAFPVPGVDACGATGESRDKLVISLQRARGPAHVCVFLPRGKWMMGMMAARTFRYLQRPNATDRNDCNDAYNYCIFTGREAGREGRSHGRMIVSHLRRPAAIFGRNARINDDPGAAPCRC